jgi:hypothetical protein
VTVGADVFFQHGRLNPQDPRWFGLLVHEATHVVERSQHVAGEEGLALAREAAVLSGPAPVRVVQGRPAPPVDQHPGVVETFGVPSFPAAAAPFPAPVAAQPAAPVAMPAGQPMTASVDRPTAMAPTVQQQQSIDVDALRGRIMRDLMRQLRDEYERGG